MLRPPVAIFADEFLGRFGASLGARRTQEFPIHSEFFPGGQERDKLGFGPAVTGDNHFIAMGSLFEQAG